MENLTAPQPENATPPRDDGFRLPGQPQQISFPLDYVTQEVLRGYFGNTVRAFPIDSIYISMVSTNPSTSLGYGTWTAFATGKMLIGVDVTEPDYDVAGDTGGSRTATLTTANLPAHTFNIQGSSSGAWGVTAGSSYGTVTGSATPVSILPPFIAVYMWRRTA